MAKLKNIHPGEILLEEFLLPLNISQNKLARAITADTDLRLSRAFGTSEGFWLGLQNDFDLEERRAKIGKQLKIIENLLDQVA